jgi:hypothetical protein
MGFLKILFSKNLDFFKTILKIQILQGSVDGV